LNLLTLKKRPPPVVFSNDAHLADAMGMFSSREGVMAHRIAESWGTAPKFNSRATLPNWLKLGQDGRTFESRIKGT
jgi:hypothetical protein